MTGMDVARLREVAEKATPGPWGVFGMTVLSSRDGSMNVDTATEIAQGRTVDDQGRPRTWDVDFIATFDPPTVLALLDALAEREARLAAVEALHRGEGDPPLCTHDLLLWPCPTYLALHPDPSEAKA